MYIIIYINYIVPLFALLGGIYLLFSATFDKKRIIRSIDSNNRTGKHVDDYSKLILIRRLRASLAGILLISMSIIFYLLTQGITLF